MFPGSQGSTEARENLPVVELALFQGLRVTTDY